MRRPSAKYRAPTTARAERARGLAPWRISLDTWWRLTKLAGWVCSLGFVIWGLDVLADYSRALPPPGACRLEWVSLPDWLRKAEYAPLLQAIEAGIDLGPDADIRTPDLAQYVYEELSKSPWISKVERVEARGTGALEVSARFRQPTAFVRDRDSDRAYLVDGEGCRLPGDVGIEKFPARNYFLITGAKRPLPPPGQPWGGDDLAAGLKLAAFLEQARAAQQFGFGNFIRAIDVAPYDRSKNMLAARLQLETIHHGCPIEWGNAPGEEIGEEASANRKLVVLNDVYANEGQLPERRLRVWWPEGRQEEREPQPRDKDKDKERDKDKSRRTR